MAPKARHAKGKARLNSYEMMLNEEQKQKEEKLEIFIPNGPRLGNKVIEAEHVAKAFGEKVLFSDLNFMLPPNGIVGVIGPNGAGKTTLFRLIMGLEQADAGTFSVGETVKLSYVDQQHKATRPSAWAVRISMYVRTLADSTSAVPTRRRSAACSAVASATVCIWPSP